MTTFFYLSSAVAVAATLLAITRSHPVHALLYLIVSLLGVAATMLTLGAPFAAMLEVIVYAGAVMVLFVFVVMLLNLGPGTRPDARAWLQARYWFGPAVLSGVLLGLLIGMMEPLQSTVVAVREVGPKEVGIALFGSYLLAVELGSMLLLAGLVAAYHLGRSDAPRRGRA